VVRFATREAARKVRIEDQQIQSYAKDRCFLLQYSGNPYKATINFLGAAGTLPGGKGTNDVGTSFKGAEAALRAGPNTRLSVRTTQRSGSGTGEKRQRALIGGNPACSDVVGRVRQ
jgi:hypothetical protein